MHREFVIHTVVHASIKSVYDVVCRPDAYQDVIPGHYPSVRVMSVRGNTSVAEEHVNLAGRELVIMAKHVAVPPRRHTTFVIGGDAKGSRIMHELAEGANVSATMVTTIVRLKTRRLGILPGMYRSKPYKESFVQIMNDLARVAESRI